MFLCLQNRKEGDPWSKVWIPEAINFTRHLYQCDYHNNVVTDYLKHASKHEFLIRHNFRVWNSCKRSTQNLKSTTSACFEPELMKRETLSLQRNDN